MNFGCTGPSLFLWQQVISLLREQKRKRYNRIFDGYILAGFKYDEMFFLCSGGGAGGDFRRGAFGVAGN